MEDYLQLLKLEIISKCLVECKKLHKKALYAVYYGMMMEEDISGTAYAMHDFFFSLPIGISYEYRKFVLDIRYIFGLQNLSSTWDVTSKSDYHMAIRHTWGAQYDNQKVNQFQLTLGYRIGL